MWTIQGETGKALDATVRTLAAVDANQPRMIFRNLGVDEFTYWLPIIGNGLAPSTEIYPQAGQRVTLFRNGVKFFSGHAAEPKQSGGTIRISVLGPWWWLERVFLESLQTDDTGATGQRATFAFPKQSLTTSLDSLLDAAIALGVPMAVGTLATTFDAMEIRLNQMSFAQAISEVVRITPDMVLWWDYSGTGEPAANTSRRKTGLAAGSAVSIDLAAAAVEDFTINPLAESTVSQVRIPYLSRAANGAKKFEVQSAGTAETGKVQIVTASGDEMDTFLPKDLLDSVEVKSTLWTGAALASLDPTITGLIEQYGNFKAGTSTSYNSSLTYYTGSNNNKLPQTVYFPGRKVRSKSGLALPSGTSYLVTGGDPLPEWAVEALGAVEVQITGTFVVVEPSSASGWSRLFAAMREGVATGGANWMNDLIFDDDKFYWLGYPLKIDGWMIPTSYAALTTIYRPSDYDFISPPAGFADGLLAAQNYLAHEGEISLIEAECGGTRYLSRAVNLTGATASFATMRAMLSSEELDLDSGTTTLVLGAPARFSYAALVGRIRGNSNSNIVYL